MKNFPFLRSIAGALIPCLLLVSMGYSSNKTLTSLDTIARAIIGKPALLIADEPTGNLDPDLAIEVMNIFKRFNEVGVTVLIASHDIHLIERFGVRRVILAQGRVVDAWDAHPEPALPEIRAD